MSVAPLLEKDADAQIQRYHEILDFMDEEFPASIQPFSRLVDSVAPRGDLKEYIYPWMSRLNNVSKGC